PTFVSSCVSPPFLNQTRPATAPRILSKKLGMTAMHVAASAGFLEIMRILATGGEDKASALSVNIVSKKHGKTPLHYAVESLQLDVVRFILGRD
ncbi:unnamed protein product, partial [Ectocarpus sp. 13 AM-2016]